MHITMAFLTSTPLPLSQQPPKLHHQLCATSPTISPKSTLSNSRSHIHMTTTPPKTQTSSDLLRITGVNLQITPSIRSYLTEKLYDRVLHKYLSYISHADVRLTVAHNPSISNKHTAEVVVVLRKHKHKIIRAEVESEGMYASIDGVAGKLKRKMRQFKERVVGKSRKMVSGKTGSDLGDEGDGVVVAEEEFSEEEVRDMEEDRRFGNVGNGEEEHVVVKKKVFPMPKQSVEDAVMCLEYIDHDFYLFREESSGEINLVYKRNHGGFGLITPEDPDAKED